jgi:hypothetical protein
LKHGVQVSEPHRSNLKRSRVVYKPYRGVLELCRDNNKPLRSVPEQLRDFLKLLRGVLELCRDNNKPLRSVPEQLRGVSKRHRIKIWSMVLGDLLVKCKKQKTFGWLNGVFEVFEGVFDGVGVLGF